MTPAQSLSSVAQFARQGALVAAGQIASALAALVGIRVLTEVLPPDQLGRLTLLLGVVLLVQGLATSPLTHVVLRFLPQAKSSSDDLSIRHIAWRMYLFSVLVALAVLVTGWGIWATLESDSLATGLILAGALASDSLRAFGWAQLSAHAKQRMMALWVGLDAWLRLGTALVLMTWASRGAETVLVGYASASLILYVLFAAAAPMIRPAASRPASSGGTYQRDMVRYAMPLIPLALVAWISAQADRFILGELLTVASVGIYGAVYGLISRPLIMLGSIVELTLRPAYYSAVTGNDPALSQQLRRKWLGMLSLSGLACVLLISLFHPLIAYICLAKAYRQYSDLMPLIGAGYCLLVIAQFYERMCYAHDQTAAGLKIQTTAAVACVCVTVPLAAHFGLMGAAAAVPSTYGIQLFVARRFAQRALGASPSRRST